jgi:hypothetical protein
MPSKTRIDYSKPGDGRDLLTTWALAPWAWAAQGVALWTMLGWSALVLGSPTSTANGHASAACLTT